MPIKLSDEQIAQYIEAFYRFDADRDEYLTRDELFSLLEYVGLSSSPDFLLKVLKELRIDSDRISKRDLLSIAKIILEERAEKTAQPKRKEQFNFNVADVSKKVVSWFEGDENVSVKKSFFGDGSESLPRSGNRVADSSKMPRHEDVVVNIDDDDASEESDYEYYTDSSDDDIHLFGEATTTISPDANRSRAKSISQGDGRSRTKSVSSKDAPSETGGARSRGKSISTKDQPDDAVSAANRSRERSVGGSSGKDPSPPNTTARKAQTTVMEDERAPLQPKKKKPVRQRGNKKPVPPGSQPVQPPPPANALAKMTVLVQKPKNSKIAALADSKVRKQLAQIHEYPPRFLLLCTIIQILVFCYELYYNQGLEPLNNNWLVGPSQLTLIQLGAKYGPCMKPDPAIVGNPIVKCHSKISPQYVLANGSCTYFDNINFVCGMGGFKEYNVPDQVWRFFTPIFLHSGVVHLLLNLFVQIKLGFKMERQMGAIRIMLIYIISGFCGFVFSGTMSYKTASVGCSGSLYGFFAILYLDLFNNWTIIKQPRRHLALLSIMVLVAFAIGLVPILDNYAHIGGFLGGFVAGMLLVPTVYFSGWDRTRKRALRLLSIPLLAMGIGLGVYSFYNNDTNYCPWCKYLNCVVPESAWCKGAA